MIRIALTVNGRLTEAEVSPRTHLADFLRDELDLTGTHLGCEHGVCGACTVEMNGEIVRSCITYAVSCHGAEIRTIEGFDDDVAMARLREAFAAEHALQCGYCTPGMLITARDLVLRKSGLAEKEIRVEMSGNLCRCTGYTGIIRAIQNVMADGLAGEQVPGAAHGYLGPAPGPCPSMDAPLSTKPAASPVSLARPVFTDPAPDIVPTAIEIVTGGVREREGWTEIEQHFTLPHGAADVWALMSDLAAVAAAMPGAELDEAPEGNRITGRMSVKIGPMRPSFAGEAVFDRDDIQRIMTIEGSGRDKRTASSAQGRIIYRVSERDDDMKARVDVTISYRLSGMLAQFGRSEIVRDVVQRLAVIFAQNINERLSRRADTKRDVGGALNALELIWSVVAARIAGFFHRLTGRSRT